MKQNNKNLKKTGNEIQSIGITNDSLTGRGGLAFIWKYIREINVIPLISEIFEGIRKSRKGRAIEQIIRQLICFYIDGSKMTMTRFDELSDDTGYMKTIGIKDENKVSSHIVKRFFKACNKLMFRKLQRLLIRLFIWRLSIDMPKVIILGLDTMVLDNNDAKKRGGVSYTYKKVAGYHPLHIYWNGFLVSIAFHEGSESPNHDNDLFNLLKDVVHEIRRKYSKIVPIIIASDTGFYDQKYFELVDKMNRTFFVCGGRILDSIKLKLMMKLPEEWKKFKKNKDIIEFLDFRDKRDSWKKEYRAIYTKYTCENGEFKLEFDRPETLIYTNLKNKEKLKQLGLEKYLDAAEIVKLYHSRGKDELVNRGIKDFIDEALPFQKFESNGIFYFLAIISYNLLIAFQKDKLGAVIAVEAYPDTIRRIFIDIAGKIVKKSGKIVLKFRQEVVERLNLIELWDQCGLVIQV